MTQFCELLLAMLTGFLLLCVVNNDEKNLSLWPTTTTYRIDPSYVAKTRVVVVDDVKKSVDMTNNNLQN